MKIVYLRTARDDFDTAYDHVAIEDCDAADRLVATIRHAVSSLKDYPRRAPEWAPGIRKLLVKGYAMLLVKGYAIMYRLADDRIEIGRILHLRRDFAKLGIEALARPADGQA